MLSTDILNKYGQKVIVWGDLILDEYIRTQSVRVSREAPVLITEFESCSFLPGGAGNVLLNLKKLGAEVIPVALIGKDREAEILCNLLTADGINLNHLLITDNFQTARNSRILAGAENTRRQQILRIDYRQRGEIDQTQKAELERRLSLLLADADLLVISDYLGQSVSIEIYNKLRQKFPQKMIALDSRRRLLFFIGADFLTPNETELKALFPDRLFMQEDDFLQALVELKAKTAARGIVLKRGQLGMIAYDGERFKKIPIYGSSEIVDVTGAGDTVLAVLSFALTAGADLFTAAELANIAGGLVVMKEGAYALSREELQAALSKA